MIWWTINICCKHLLDHDECGTAKHDCQHKCENTVGGYVCGCPKGFQLNKDKKTCSG